jgi:hypothetical protein
MRRPLATFALTGAAALAAAPAASAARVEALVVGPHGILRGPKAVTLEQRTVKVAHRRCAVGAKTPLSVLAATGLKLGIRDQGACNGNPKNAGALYVFRVGSHGERGRSGWVYKVGNRSGTTGSADPTGPFGTGRALHGGQRVLWFWCTLKGSGGCQRTLDARPDRTTAAPGQTLRVTVRGYDDQGRGVAVQDAAVRLGGARGVTGADGVATLTVPKTRGRLRLRATHAGLVPAFPREVRVR